MLFLLLVFTAQSYIVIDKRSDTNFVSAKLTRYFDDGFTFTEENGFQMAFAVIDWESDDGSDAYERPLEEYLEVELLLETLIDNETQDPIKVPLHQCTKSELGLTEDGTSKFYPINPELKKDLELYYERFFCFDNTAYGKIAGDFNSVTSSNLAINLIIPEHLCTAQTIQSYCVPSVDYKKKMQNKFLVTLTNQKRFESDNYSRETPIVKESVTDWREIPREPQLITLEVRQTQLVREDNLIIAINDVTEFEEEYFSIEQNKIYTQLPERTAFELDFYLNKDLTRVERSVYNTFMLLGDVGGLYGFLSGLFAFFLGIINHSKF